MRKRDFTSSKLNSQTVGNFPHLTLQCRRVVSVIALFFFLTSVFSLDINALIGAEHINENDAEIVVDLYAPDNGVEYSIVSQKELLSPSVGDYAYTLYSLDPYGYIILLNESLGLMEASYDYGVECPIDINSNDDYFYVSPWSFVIKDDEKLINAISGDTVSSDLFDQLQSLESNARNYENNKNRLFNGSIQTNSNLVSPATSIYVEILESYHVDALRGTDYFDNLTDFGTNTQGTCTVLATSILLGYYDIIASDSYVASEFEQGDGTSDAFHRHLNEYVYGTQVPSTSQAPVYIRNIVDDINRYLDSRSIYANFNSMNIIVDTDSLTNTVISKVRDEEIPVILSVETLRGAEWNHTVVVYGVKYYPSNPLGTATYFVHTGWHNGTTHAEISAGWAYECGYIECGKSSHNVGMSYVQYSSSQHIAKCDCGANIKESHLLALASDGRKCCIKCGWGT